MTRDGEHADVYEIDKGYEKGVTADGAEWKQVKARSERPGARPEWHVLVRPQAA